MCAIYLENSFLLFEFTEVSARKTLKTVKFYEEGIAKYHQRFLYIAFFIVVVFTRPVFKKCNISFLYLQSKSPLSMTSGCMHTKEHLS